MVAKDLIIYTHNERKIKMNVEINGDVIVIDDNIDIKVIRSDNNYKLVILKSNIGDVNVEFTDDVSMFE